MATFTSFPTTISISGSWGNSGRFYQLASSTSTFIQYELYNASGLVGLPYGIQFKNPTNSLCTLDVEGSGDLGTPFTIGSTSGSSTQSVASGDSVSLYESSGAVLTLDVPNFFTSSSSSSTTQKKVFCNFW